MFQGGHENVKTSRRVAKMQERMKRNEYTRDEVDAGDRRRRKKKKKKKNNNPDKSQADAREADRIPGDAGGPI